MNDLNSPILSPDHEALPFLVVHGAWLWKAVIVVSAIAGAFAWQALRHWRARRAARRLVATAPATVTTMREGEVVLRGTLRLHVKEKLGTEHLLRRGNPGPEHIADRDEVISIEQGDESVVLGGPVVVVSGTSARSSRRRVRWSIVNTLRDGDQVEAHGVGSLVAHPGGSDYRTNASSWELHGDPIRLYAVKPRALASPVGPLRAVVTLAAVAFAIWTSFQIAGSALEEEIKEWRLPPDGVGELDVLPLAAALPSTRSGALERYASELQRPSGPARVRRLMALADVMGRCNLPNRALVERQRWPALLDRGRRCGDTDAMLEALVSMGRFEEAAEVAAVARSPWPFLQGVSMIATGRWKEAATQAEAMASRWAEERGDDAETQRIKWHARMHFTCLAELFRWRGGDAGAAERLRNLASGAAASECRVIATELLPGDERFRALIELHGDLTGRTDEAFQTTNLVSSLLWAQGARKHQMASDVASFGMRRFESNVEPWLAPYGIAARSAESPDWADALALLSLWQSMRGDVDAARRTAAMAASLVEADEPWTARGLLGATALHSRDPEANVDDGFTEPGAAVLTALRRGVATSTLPEYFVDEECQSDARRALAAAARGDGHPLALLVMRCSLSIRADEVLLAVGPRIRAGAHDLATALIWSPRPGLRESTSDPLRLFTYAAMRRDLFLAIGDAEEASMWAEIVRRYIVVLEDRDRAVALMFWTM